MPCDDGGRHGGDASPGQGMQRIATNTRSQEKGNEQMLPGAFRQRAWPWQHLGFKLLASRTIRTLMSDVLSFPVWQPGWTYLASNWFLPLFLSRRHSLCLHELTLPSQAYPRPWDGTLHLCLHLVKHRSLLLSFSLLKLTYFFSLSLLTSSLLITLPGMLSARSTSPGGIPVILRGKNCIAQHPNFMSNISFQLACLPDSHSRKTFQTFHTVDHFIKGKDHGSHRQRYRRGNYYEVWGKFTCNASKCFLLFIKCYEWINHLYSKLAWQEANSEDTRETALGEHSFTFIFTVPDSSDISHPLGGLPWFSALSEA